MTILLPCPLDGANLEMSHSCELQSSVHSDSRFDHQKV
jgi:hypothetical protein